MEIDSREFEKLKRAERDAMAEAARSRAEARMSRDPISSRTWLAITGWGVALCGGLISTIYLIQKDDIKAAAADIRSVTTTIGDNTTDIALLKQRQESAEKRMDTLSDWLKSIAQDVKQIDKGQDRIILTLEAMQKKGTGP